MFEWIIEHILIRLPDLLWIGMAIFGCVIFMSGTVFNYYSRLLPYSFLIKPLAALFIYSGIYMYGAKQINDIWLQKIEEQEKIVESYERASADLGKVLDSDHMKELGNIKKDAVEKQKRIASLEEALRKANNSTKGQAEFFAGLTKEQQEKFNSMTEEQRKEYQLATTILQNLNLEQRNELLVKNKTIEVLEKQLAELAVNTKNCPIVPSIIIDQINDAAKRKVQ